MAPFASIQVSKRFCRVTRFRRSSARSRRDVLVAVHRDPNASKISKPVSKATQSNGSRTISIEHSTQPRASRFPPSLITSRHIWTPLFAVLGFSAIAHAVFPSDGSSLLLSLDYGVHDWVHHSIPPSIRSNFFAKGISNLFIEADLAIGAVLLLTHWLGNRVRGVKLMGLTAFFYAAEGSHTDEGWLEHALKHAFHRSRPTDEMLSYAFPSGHVMSAVFLTGALLYVWLPTARQGLNSATPVPLQRLIKGLDRVFQRRELIWGLSYICTAMGRVGADVHWISDTMAGCLVGIALVSMFKSLHEL